MLSEILEIPAKAKDFLSSSSPYALPFGVPYIGMGSSYFAPLCFKYMGLNIQPEMASEYAQYLHKGVIQEKGVLLSQSGRSTEVLWCADLFDSYIAICNYVNSPLCTSQSADMVVPLLAGEERYSSSKTYINTLLALFIGFRFDVQKAVDLLQDKMNEYDAKGKQMASDIYKITQERSVSGLYITGSGPNIGTALQAALILSESTKLAFIGLPMAQYDHGPKETAKDSIVIQIVSKGNSYERTKVLRDTIARAGATVYEVEEDMVDENESILHNIIPFNYMAYYLAQHLGVEEIFSVGAKVTEVK